MLDMTSDGELLRRYTETNSEDAFAELVPGAVNTANHCPQEFGPSTTKLLRNAKDRCRIDVKDAAAYGVFRQGVLIRQLPSNRSEQ